MLNNNLKNMTGAPTGFEDIRYVKRITVGSVNPNLMLSDEQREKQFELLNRCLNEFPRGKIIGREVSFGVYMMGEHQLSMEQITYHVGFRRKPHWMED